MIQCRNLHKHYRSGSVSKAVLKGVDFVINPRDRVALLGRNGAGKSTLIRLIGGVEMPTSGKVIRQMSCSWPLGFNGGFQGSLTGYDNARFIARIYDKPYAENARLRRGLHRAGRPAADSCEAIFIGHCGHDLHLLYLWQSSSIAT